MDEFLKQLYGKNIHVVGVTGSEGSSILRFLIKNNVTSLKVHDLLLEGSIEKSFRLWHKGILGRERERAYEQFRSDLTKTEFYTGKNYLQGIDKAQIIFVPQSWRLYKENFPLTALNKKNKSIFYSLTKLYLSYARAIVVGVTGTVAKGSVANLLFEILKEDLPAYNAGLPAGRQVYFAGNETWRIQLLDKLDLMNKKDIFILEISHRQLLDGFERAPHILIFTNLYPNHLDEMTFEEYKKLKFSLLLAQTDKDICVLNYDNHYLREEAGKLKSKVYFFSAKDRNMNIKDVQKIYDYFLNNKSIHYFDNILASSTAAALLGISDAQIIDSILHVKPLTARLNEIATRSGIKFFDDIKSTTPWATLAAIDRLGSKTILICGGRVKGIEYKDFFTKIKNKIKKIIILESELLTEVKRNAGNMEFSVATNLEDAVKLGYKLAEFDGNILVSPGAAFFYSDFIKDKKSLLKIITSLPPKEQAQ